MPELEVVPKIKLFYKTIALIHWNTLAYYGNIQMLIVHIYIYIYIYMCVCVCVCVLSFVFCFFSCFQLPEMEFWSLHSTTILGKFDIWAENVSVCTCMCVCACVCVGVDVCAHTRGCGCVCMRLSITVWSNNISIGIIHMASKVLKGYLHVKIYCEPFKLIKV